MSNPDTVSVIIPNFNGKQYLEPCLRSVLEQQIAPRQLEVIVVDNASTDGSTDLRADVFPNVSLIRNEQNVGYTRAINQGIERSQGRWVLLLNNDTILQPGSLKTLLDSLTDGPAELGGVQPLLLFAGNPSIIDSTGIAISAHFRARDNRHGETVVEGAFPAGDIWGCCAACVLVKREVYDRCGMLDPDFFAEWDDVDFSLRARWHGYSFRLVPPAVVWHHRSPTSLRDPIAKIMRHRRNQLLTILKAAPAGLAARWILYRFFRDLSMIPHSLRRHEFTGVIRVWKEFFSLTPTMLRRRRELMRNAVRTSREMSRELSRFMRQETSR